LSGPPHKLQMDSHTGGKEGSILRVVHERGHVSWHVPNNPLIGLWPFRLVQVFWPNRRWSFDIPHVAPGEGEETFGFFGQVGRKIITEIRFSLLTLTADRLLEYCVGKWEKSRLPKPELKRVDLDAPSGPLVSYAPRDIAAGQAVLLFVHGTASDTMGAFGE